METEKVKKNFDNIGKDLIITKKDTEKFIIYNIDNPSLLNCILSVVSKTDTEVTLRYTDFDLSEKEITVNINDGEIYTDDVILRRKKELAIRNILSLMEYHDIKIDDLNEGQ